MIAGLDVLSHRAGHTVRAFAEEFGVPVITTYKAKGVIPEDHPLSLGAAGLSPKADDILLPLVARSDFILLAGYDPIEMRMGWRNPWPPTTPVVELSGSAHSHSMFPVTSLFVGHIGAGLQQLRRGLTARSSWPEDQLRTIRRKLQDAFAPEPEWGPGVIIDAAMDVLPKDARIAVDTGAHRILLSQMWRCSSPRQIIQSTGLCTMGCALPMAIGLRLADPGRPVVAFVGDGGLDMVLGELATARDLAVSITVVVFDDSSLSLIEKKQRGRGLPRQAVNFGKTDYPAVARALGCTGFLATSRDELTRALRASLSTPDVCVISCPIDVGAYDGRI
jgi:acetolactate synthase-1/2/3 large subunit